MNFKAYFNNIFLENTNRVDENFRKQLIGAFELTFNIDQSDIIDKESPTFPTFSHEMGMRSLQIGNFDFRVPMNANTVLSSYFYITYKMRKYLIDIMTYNWMELPTEEDFVRTNHGKNLKTSLNRTLWDFKKPSTATGRVYLDDYIYNIEKEKEEREKEYIGEINEYPTHFKYHNLMELASKVKSIIDGRDDKRTNIKPLSPSGKHLTFNKPSKEPVSTLHKKGLETVKNK